MRLLKLLRGMSFLSIILLIAYLLVAVIRRPYTPPIRPADGESASASIAALEEIELGGAAQWILVRGRNASNPVLLFLHGGPGMPAMYLAHAFQRPLEEDFVVVQWDRRGAGKSLDPTADPWDLRVSRMLADTRELVDTLRTRFGKEKIYLVGHSWGSYLGMLYAQRHPETLHAFVGVGQVVDDEAARAVQERFIEERARASGRTKALDHIERAGERAYERWLFEFGGELHGATTWWPLLWTGLQAPEYGLLDVLNVPKGSSRSSRHMVHDVIDGPLIDHVTDVDVPVYFFAGRHDYTTPFELVQRYHRRLRAPRKDLVWFEHSAHFPFFEEPDAFADAMRRVTTDLPGL